MFYGFVGKKGAGKSFGAMRIIVEELRKTERHIFTNLPIHMGRLQAWCDKHIAHKVVDVALRITIMRPEQLSRFWLLYGGGMIEKTQFIPIPGGKREVPDFGVRAGDGGLFFCIDEAHIAFPSDAWQAVAQEASFYCTQERKLGDDTLFVTQLPGQMAKPLRELMAEWTETRNMNREPIMGCRFPGRFKWRWTFQVPGSQNCEAFRHSVVRLDKELADCYDTHAGVGLVGMNTHEQEPSFGLRWQVWVVTAVAAVVLVMFGVYGGVRFGVGRARDAVVNILGIPTPKQPTGSVMATVAPSMSELLSQQPKAKVEPVGPFSFAPGETTKVVGNHVEGGRTVVKDAVLVKGWASGGGRVRVYLTDGRVLSDKDPQLSSIGPDGVRYGGELLRYAPRENSGVPVEVPPVNMAPELTGKIRVESRK